MPFLFKIIAILIGIFIWKTVMASFAKARKAMRDDEDREEPDTCDGENGPAPQATLFRNGQWKLAAQQLACAFDPGKRNDGRDVSISGTVSGHAVTVKRFGHNYVRYFVAFRRPLRSRVCVVRDLEPIAKRILDGHPVFSSKMFFPSREPDFFCSADSEEAFDRFLNVPSNRSAVLNLVHTFPAGMFNSEGVSVRLRAMTPDPGTLRQMIELADALESPSNLAMPDLTTAPKKDLLSIPPAQSLSPVSPVKEEDTPKRFPPIQIGEERRREDGGAKEPGGQAVFAEPDIPAEPDISAEPVASAEPASEPLAADICREGPATPSTIEARDSYSGGSVTSSPSEAGDIRSGGPASLDVESVCSVLFAKSFPGAEERAAFEAMKGRRVRWSGKIQMVLPFSMDFTFGSNRGVKATLFVHEMSQGQSGTKVRIKAVAAFPPEFQGALEASKGKTVVFSGELLKFEPFAREIYLRNATLEA